MTDNNAFTGPIPSEIGNLSELSDLNLCEWASTNRVKKNSHPVRLSHTFLVLLDSSRMAVNNELTGPIPSEIGNLAGLHRLWLCKWAFVDRVKEDVHPVRLSHIFLVLLDSSRMTDGNKLTDPMPKAEIESLPLRICSISSKLFLGKRSSYSTNHIPSIHDVCSFLFCITKGAAVVCSATVVAVPTTSPSYPTAVVGRRTDTYMPHHESCRRLHS
jgi:hypothetical protein